MGMSGIAPIPSVKKRPFEMRRKARNKSLSGRRMTLKGGKNVLAGSICVG